VSSLLEELKAIEARLVTLSTKSANLDVAKTILEQLGGKKFIVMTGAKNLVGSKNSLSFNIGRNAGSINGVRIELRPSDLYTISFLRIRKGDVKTVKEFKDVYADQLQELFTQVTGMYTHL
jgi:hypothetical protein